MQGTMSYSPRTTSLTVQRAEDKRDTAEEKFFKQLEEEVDKIGKFTAETVEMLRERLYNLQQKLQAPSGAGSKEEMLKEAQSIGDAFLQLEKYVNLNYMGFHKILKKHDKMLPHSPCRQFYVSHLHNQPWVQGSFADLLVTLGNVYAEIRGDEVAHVPHEERNPGYSTNKYWVNMADISQIKHMILPHLPVYQFDENEYTGDSQLVNSVYLDNSSLEVYHNRLEEHPNTVAIRLSWYGTQEPVEVHVQRKLLKESLVDEENVHHEFVLPADKVVRFIEGELEVEEAVAFWKSKQYSQNDIQQKADLFEEIKRIVDSKQLKPTIRTQYMRTYFQIPFDPSVRIKLDTNICMMKENPEDGPGCISAGRWFRDPSLPVHRTEITRFPHAVLELKLALTEGQETPSWVQELVESGMLDEVNRFSKHLHGVCTLFPDMAQSVPYWVDRESVRASMLSSAPEQSMDLAPHARDVLAKKEKPRKGNAQSGLLEPLLERESKQIPSVTRKIHQTPSFIEWWFSKPPMKSVPKIPGVVQDKIEPKTYFANERTFLSWLHMALTMGSIATAMIGVSTGNQDDSTTMIALILLPVALLMCGYSLFVYYWRAKAIREKTDLYYDDRRGPLALTIVVVGALIVIFLMSVVDLFSMLEKGSNTDLDHVQDPQSWLRSTLLYKLLHS